MDRINVNLKEKSYSIVVGSGFLDQLGFLLAQKQFGKEVFVITDAKVRELHGEALLSGLSSLDPKIIEIPRGEQFKNVAEAMKIIDKLVDFSAHRDSVLIAFGGGVIGDIAGFVAATYMRGINYIQVPTTLLAQVDASIGGKTGVNHPKGKNLIGAFYQPKLVYIDIKTLTTLPERELQTGLAEVVKYGVIADADFFKFLEANAHHLNTNAFKAPDTLRAALKVWQTIVKESAQVKAKVVEKDEKEAVYRMILNFGHTIGHALETNTGYQTYNHGEAVAVGMVAAAKISSELNMLDQNAVERITELLQKLCLPTKIEKVSCSDVLTAIGLDKKVREGKLHFVLPDKIGHVVIKDDVPREVIEKVLERMGCQ
ncbi:MAG: 3-dehydroquinate synthase [bacterium]